MHIRPHLTEPMFIQDKKCLYLHKRARQLSRSGVSTLSVNTTTLQTEGYSVCATDSDVTFISSDGTLFKVHQRNLAVTSEGFSPPDETSSAAKDVIPLSETAKVLELLFQFMYPQRQPDLTDVPFDLISALAEAAEKYQVFSAMGQCSTMMRCVRYHD